MSSENGSPNILTIENFIDGSFCEAERYIDSFNPSTGEVWARIPDSSSEDVDKAVEAARNAFPRYLDYSLNNFSINQTYFVNAISVGPKQQLRAELKSSAK